MPSASQAGSICRVMLGIRIHQRSSAFICGEKDFLGAPGASALSFLETGNWKRETRKSAFIRGEGGLARGFRLSLETEEKTCERKDC